MFQRENSLTFNAIAVRHEDCPIDPVTGLRVFPPQQMLEKMMASGVGTNFVGVPSVFYTVPLPPNQNEWLQMTCKQVQIPTGVGTVFGTFNYFKSRPRPNPANRMNVYIADGNTAVTLAHPLVTASGTNLSGGALNITYILQRI